MVYYYSISELTCFENFEGVVKVSGGVSGFSELVLILSRSEQRPKEKQESNL